MPSIDSAVVLAGGLGTRMRPLTTDLPKAMLPVAGRPFIEHQIALLRRKGIKRIILCLGHLGALIERHVDDGERFGVRVLYSRDGPRPLGTAGALRNALALLPDVFFVTYGDSYLPCDWEAAHVAFTHSMRRALMVVYRNENLLDRSNVLYKDGEILAYDKRNPYPSMRHIDYGLAVVHRDVVAGLAPGVVIDLADVYASLLARGELAGYETQQRFYEIGSPAGLAELESSLTQRGGRLDGLCAETFS